MTQLQMLKKQAKAIQFSKSACWIDGMNCEESEWLSVEVHFSSNNDTTLLLAAGDGAQVYINNVLVHRFTTRSYVFDKAYEALDVSDYLEQEDNIFRFQFRHVSSRELRGLLFEITDGSTSVVSNDQLTAHRIPRLSPGCNWNIHHHTSIERYDENKEEIGETIALESFGSAYHCIPFEKLHQTNLPVPTRYLQHPKKIVQAERYESPKGLVNKISGRPQGCGKAIYYTTVTCQKVTDFALYYLHNSDKLVIDGIEACQARIYQLTPGSHTIAILGSDLYIQIRSDAFLSEWRLLPLSVPALPTPCYAWNDSKVVPTISADENALCYCTNYTSLATIPAIISEIQSTEFYRTFEYYTSDDSITDSLSKNWKPRKKLGSAGIEVNGQKALIHPHALSCAVCFDFGTEQVGYPMIHIQSKSKVELEVLCYEVLSTEGDIYLGEHSKLKYIAPAGDHHYLSFCRRGFKYMKVFLSPAEEDIEIEVACENSHCPVPMETVLHSDCKRLNDVFQMSLDTARVCMLDYYVDCPGYEQNIWVGDATITSLINLYCFGQYDTNAEYLRLIGESMSDKLTEYYRTNNSRYVARQFLPCACFPTYPDRNIAIWSFQWILAVFFHYQTTGDLKLVHDVIVSIEETLKRSEDWFSPRGLFNMEGTWNLIEWANNDLSEYGEVLCNNMMLVECYRRVADLEIALGNNSIAKQYITKAKKLKDAINQYGWNKEMNMYVDTIRDDDAYEYYKTYCEHTLSEPEKRHRCPVSKGDFKACQRVSVQTATFAILYNIAEGERLEICKNILSDNIRNGNYVAGTPALRTVGKPSEKEAPDGIVKIGSPFFMYFALDALYSIGAYDLCELAMKRDWGAMLDIGLRNCTEVFNTPGKITTRSIAHAWSASPAYFLSKYTLGVTPLDPGFKTFTVQPKSSSLSHASGVVKTPFGDIEVSWKKSGNDYTISCSYPNEIRHIK